MGLPELWETIREFQEVKPIAQLAEEHYKQHGRPFRIAIDEPDWRYNNLTPTQVHEIRNSSTEAFRGLEKAMFYRICKFLTRNIQLVFVFDGPGVPTKRGRTGGRKIDYQKRRDLQKMLRCFGIPYQEAPGEAEAECARLQVLGLVDAVFSQDSDSLMFGCGLWIHDHRVAKDKGNNDRGKENTKKSDTHVRVVRAKDMADQLGLDRQGFVLFAMLVGGDYDAVGLRGCGAALALSAVREGRLAKSLCQCRSQRDCADWSQCLAAFLRTKPRSRHLVVPACFPDYKILQKYYRPKVTPDELLLGNKNLDLSVPRPIQERKLLEVTSKYFNIWGRLYMNWVGPILLMRSLLARDDSCPKSIVHGIKLVKQHASKSEEVVALRLVERKITFSPFEVTSLAKADLEGGERDGMWDGVRGVPVDYPHRVECDYFPVFFLHQALPQETFQPPPVSKQMTVKRKKPSGVDTANEGTTIPAAKRLKPTKGKQTSPLAHMSEVTRTNSHALPSSPADALSVQSGTSASSTGQHSPHYQGKAPAPYASKQPTSQSNGVIDLSTSEIDLDMVLRLPPVRHTQSTVSLRQSLSLLDDHHSPGSQGDQSEDLAHAIHLNMQSSHLKRVIPEATSHTRSSNTSQLMSMQVESHTCLSSAKKPSIQMTSASRATEARLLHQIREARLKHVASSPTRPSTRIPSGTMSARPAVREVAECIDLTGG